MARFIVRSPVTLKSPIGSHTWKKGEALRLSTSSTTASLVSHGFLVEEHIGVNLLDRYEARVKVLVDKLGYSPVAAQSEALQFIGSLLKRHESFKSSPAPSYDFLAEVVEFNQNSTGNNPITKVDAETGVGEWAGYRCNIGSGCSHGCLYCYAAKMAVRFKRAENSEAWLEETLKDVSTAICKRYDSSIMFPTSHDITPAYLSAYRCHLYNLLTAGNRVVVVTKPHQESIEGIVSELSSFRDQITFRFTIGGLDGDAMRHWEPGAPPIEERINCLKCAFENGFQTSVSVEPMHRGKDEAVKLYHYLEPYISEDIWFGKMNNIGGFRTSADPEVARHAQELLELQSNDEIMELVSNLSGLPKVEWKDSIKEIIANMAG